MYDAIDPASLPAGGDAVAGYLGGSWPTYADGSLAKVAAGRRMVSIATEAQYDADILDIERFDATDWQAVGWVKRHSYTPVPGLYRSVSKVGPLVQLLEHYNVHRSRYLIWSAHWTGHPHICTSEVCAPSSPVPWTADGTQWNSLPGYDESLLAAGFFDTYPTVPYGAGPVSPAVNLQAHQLTPTTPITLEDQDMPWLLRTEGEPGVYLVDGGSRSHVDAASLETLVGRFGPVLVLDKGTVSAIPIAKP